jgi:ATP-dependent protease HslVU (ClpYQ) peptidase subunit
VTTIATDGVTIASDGRTTAGDRIVDDASLKLHRMPDGSIVGQSGRCSHALVAIEELSDAIGAGRLPKLMRGDYQLLQLHENGRVYTYDCELVALPTPTPAACGSGAAYALGAMHSGAAPNEAVRIAKRLDSSSGGKVRTMKPRN